MSLSGSSSYTGGTTVNAGTLNLGSLSQIGSSSVNFGVAITAGTAMVQISGGTVQALGIAVGATPGAVGSMQVSDATTVLTANGNGTSNGSGAGYGGALSIGTYGNGTLTQSGGLVQAQNSYIMIGNDGGSGTYTMTGGILQQSGSSGSDQRTLIGWTGVGSQGTLNVGGNAVANLGGDLDIAYVGTGTVTITQSGSVTTVASTNFGNQSGSIGTLNLNGGTLTTNGMTVGSGTPW